MVDKKFSRLVFGTHETIRYQFPTHAIGLVMDRSEAVSSEAFVVMLQPGESPPLHVHHDTEQVFYILEGTGELHAGAEAEKRLPVSAGDLVRVPPGTYHRILCKGSGMLKYLSVDCFLNGCPVNEPTWESRVRVVCAENGWDFDAVKRTPNSSREKCS